MQIKDISDNIRDKVRDHARAEFVGNECGTDEYRETQPGKGFMFIAEMFDLVQYDPQGSPLDDQVEMLREIRTWIDAIIRTCEDVNSKTWEVSYAGAAELEPVLTRMFDMCWADNRHPYEYSAEELIARYHEDLDDDAQGEAEHHAH